MPTVSTARVTSAATSGSRSAGCSGLSGKTCVPPLACSIAAITSTTSSTRTRRSSKVTSTRPTASFTAAHSTPSRRSSWRRSARRTEGPPATAGVASSRCARPRDTHTRRLRRAAGGSNIAFPASVSRSRLPSVASSTPATTAPAARAPALASTVAVYTADSATAPAVARACRTGGATRDPASEAVPAARPIPVAVTWRAVRAARRARRAGPGSPTRRSSPRRVRASGTLRRNRRRPQWRTGRDRQVAREPRAGAVASSAGRKASIASSSTVTSPGVPKQRRRGQEGELTAVGCGDPDRHHGRGVRGARRGAAASPATAGTVRSGPTPT